MSLLGACTFLFDFLGNKERYTKEAGQDFTHIYLAIVQQWNFFFFLFQYTLLTHFNNNQIIAFKETIFHIISNS